MLSYLALKKARRLAKLRRLVAATQVVRAIAKRLRAARLQAGWTQAKLAAAIGVDAPMLSRYEAGMYPAPVDMLWRVSTHLGVRLSELVDVDVDLPRVMTAPGREKFIPTQEQRKLLEAWGKLRPMHRKVVEQLCRVLGKVDSEARWSINES